MMCGRSALPRERSAPCVPFCTINGRGGCFIARPQKFFQKIFSGKKPGQGSSPARLPYLFLLFFKVCVHAQPQTTQLEKPQNKIYYQNAVLTSVRDSQLPRSKHQNNRKPQNSLKNPLFHTRHRPFPAPFFSDLCSSAIMLEMYRFYQIYALAARLRCTAATNFSSSPVSLPFSLIFLIFPAHSS